MSNDKNRWMPNENFVSFHYYFHLSHYIVRVSRIFKHIWLAHRIMFIAPRCCHFQYESTSVSICLFENLFALKWSERYPKQYYSKNNWVRKLHIYTHDKVILKHWLLSFWAILYPNFRLLYQTIFGVHFMICFIARLLAHSLSVLVWSAVSLLWICMFCLLVW